MADGVARWTTEDGSAYMDPEGEFVLLSVYQDALLKLSDALKERDEYEKTLMDLPGDHGRLHMLINQLEGRLSSCLDVLRLLVNWWDSATQPLQRSSTVLDKMVSQARELVVEKHEREIDA